MQHLTKVGVQDSGGMFVSFVLVRQVGFYIFDY